MHCCENAEMGSAANGQENAVGEKFFELGIIHSTERSDAIDLVAAHKWFNLAALQGNKKAVELRLEIAAEMSPSEIAAAQRAARDWLATH